jgi:hypothetical protein
LAKIFTQPFILTVFDVPAGVGVDEKHEVSTGPVPLYSLVSVVRVASLDGLGTHTPQTSTFWQLSRGATPHHAALLGVTAMLTDAPPSNGSVDLLEEHATRTKSVTHASGAGRSIGTSEEGNDGELVDTSATGTRLG